MRGIELIAQERKEQIEKHKWDDSKNNNYELSEAALYCINPINNEWPMNWSVEAKDKIDNKTYYEQLIIAGALIAAEIDRLQNESN